MDINLLRIAVTVVAFFVFIALAVWAYLPSHKAQFEDAAQLPFRSD
jgi:cytochrome c oxidase cbb3-type subunit IV